jgi:hypothetical protein
MLQTCHTGRAQAHLRNVAGVPHRSSPRFVLRNAASLPHRSSAGSFCEMLRACLIGRAQVRFAKCRGLGASVGPRFVLRNVANLPHRSSPGSFCEMSGCAVPHLTQVRFATCNHYGWRQPFSHNLSSYDSRRERLGACLPAAQGWNYSHWFACDPWTILFTICTMRRAVAQPTKARKGQNGHRA